MGTETNNDMKPVPRSTKNGHFVNKFVTYFYALEICFCAHSLN